MKLPIKWLKDYVDIDVDGNELANALTLSGSKVEGVENPFDVLSNIVTSRITKIEKHPEADKLAVCTVNIGGADTLEIVTAATNMQEGDAVPLALHNSVLYDGTVIKKGKLRGVVSNGMFCSEEELGLKEKGTTDGLMILPENTASGLDIRKALGLDGSILDLEITSNRPDCLSVLGLAREVAAVYELPLKLPEMQFTAKDTEAVPVKVELNTPLVRRYMAREIRDVKIGESPEWIRTRLLEAGIRPKNNMVDLTNFVMLELGQPLHAFDKREISSGIIRVTESAGGESFVTLDENTRTLPEKTILINDDTEVIGIAGIMGGLHSEIKEDTKSVIIESANFDGLSVRNASAAMGLRTEASTRFDKDIDPNLVPLAMDRLCSLVTSLGIGEVLGYTVDEKQAERTPNHLEVPVSYINGFLGTDIPAEKMVTILESLFVKTKLEGGVLKLETPTFRNDLFIKEDIAEEIARIYGYNEIQATVPHVNAARSGRYRHQILRKKLETLLVAQGLYESISYSFVSRKDFDRILLPEDSSLRNAVEIRNPLGEDFSVMRTSMLASMMESLSRNENRSNEEAALFEIGKVYLKEGDKLPREKETLIIGMYGKDLFYNLKGILETLTEEFGLENPLYKRSENTFFHPGKSADVLLGRKLLATFGEVHPKASANYGMDKITYILEMDLSVLYSQADLERKYSPIAKFPSVTRDIAVIMDDEILVQDMESIFRKQGGSLLESFRLFDVYKGAQMPEGKKSVAYNLVYRHPERTLTDKEVQKVHDKIVRTLETLLGATLR